MDLLITDEELATFLALEKDYQRDAFIKQFWEVARPLQGDARNEFQDRWEANVAGGADALRQPGGRPRPHAAAQRPARRSGSSSRCSTLIWPVEVWFYAGSERMRSEFIVVFYRKWGAGPFRDLERRSKGSASLFVGSGGSGRRQQHSLRAIANGCTRRRQARRRHRLGAASQGMGYTSLQRASETKPERPDRRVGRLLQLLLDRHARGRDPAAGQARPRVPRPLPEPHRGPGAASACPAPAPGSRQLGGRTAPTTCCSTARCCRTASCSTASATSSTSPATAAGAGRATLPLVFQRYLRPGDYTLIVKLEDINSGKVFREERTITVPGLGRARAAAAAAGARGRPRAPASWPRPTPPSANGETTLKLVRPFGELQTGMQRFDTLTTGRHRAGDLRPGRQAGAHQEEAALQRRARPRLAPPARASSTAARLRRRPATEVAGDEMLINSAANRFQVRLVEPQRGKRYESSLLARAEVEAPDGQTVERVEFFLNETLVATLYQPPYSSRSSLPKGEEHRLRARRGLSADGNSTESLVFVNAPENMAEVNINFVELYTTVLDRKRRPVRGARAEGLHGHRGRRQAGDRPLRAGDRPADPRRRGARRLGLDGRRASTRRSDAALQFLQRTIRPKDRAAVVTFNDHPNLAVKFTNDVPALAGGLAGLKAERGTALYDSVIFTLYYFTGVKGQRALLLLSDGKDEGSRFTFEDALDYARRAGVTIYTIGLGDDVDKRKLDRLAEETGGRAFFLKNADELPGIYADDRAGAALAVPDRLPVDQHQRRQHFRTRRAEGRQARPGGEDDPGVLPVRRPFRWRRAEWSDAALPTPSLPPLPPCSSSPPASPPAATPPASQISSPGEREAIAKLPEKYRAWLAGGRRPPHRGGAGDLPGARQGLPARRLHRAVLGGAGPRPRTARNEFRDAWESKRARRPRPVRRPRRRARPRDPASTAPPTSGSSPTAR